MSDCGCGKNQTPNVVWEYIASQPEKRDELGTGLFLVPDPVSGVMESVVVIASELSYVECAKRGAECLAFKWIPSGYMSEATVREERQNCSSYWCNSNTYCPVGCLCDRFGFCR